MALSCCKYCFKISLRFYYYSDDDYSDDDYSDDDMTILTVLTGELFIDHEQGQWFPNLKCTSEETLDANIPCS
eukprot:scaffold24297_cov89-Skeletonema_marinoi.AAC.1